MRVAVITAGLLVCVALAAAQGGDNGPPPGIPRPLIPTQNGDKFTNVDDCTAIGAPFCNRCENPGLLCYRCAWGSILYSDHRGCKPCSDNCKVCEWRVENLQTNCLECNIGFYLDRSGRCQPCGTLCGECDLGIGTSTVCTEDGCIGISRNSNVDKAHCISCGSFCEACNLSPLDAVTCTKCETGYVLVDGSCQNCPSNCDNCVLDGTSKLCTQCRGNYQPSVDEKSCVVCPFGCSSCNGILESDTSRSACTACIPNYYLTDDKQCFECLDNCAVCDEVGKCTTCDPSHYKSDDDGSQCIACPWRCKDCRLTNNAVSCTDCDPYFTTKLATSVTCDPCPSNCDLCSVTGAVAGNCLDCSQEYYLDAGNTCKKCSANCLECASNTVCVLCKPGYYRADDDACYKIDDNCVSATIADSFYNTTANKAFCFNCDAGFTTNADDTACLPCPAGCDWCTNNANAPGAVECICPGNAAVDTFTFGSDQYRGLCTGVTPVMYACKLGYYYDDTTNAFGVCTSCNIDGCEHCNATLGLTDCWRCSSTSFVAAPNAQGNCDACSSNCLTCTSSTVCLNCDTDYDVDDDRCKRCGSFCQSCNIVGTTSTCNTCQTQATPHPTEGDRCLRCETNCLSCSSSGDGTACDTCDTPDYILDNGICLKCVDFCSSCEVDAGTVKCLAGQCNAGYGRKSDGLCYPCPAECRLCSVSTATDASDELQCDDCMVKFTENDEVCVPCPSNCPTCTETLGTVLGASAQTTYYLDGQGECPKCTSNCIRCTATTCSECAASYGLSADKKTCTPCSSLTLVNFCNECTDADLIGASTCMSCRGGYTLSDNMKECSDHNNIEGLCIRYDDHMPECTDCEGATGRFLVASDEPFFFDFPKLCTYECQKCGSFDRLTNTILSGTDDICNAKKDANYTGSEYCYDGYCAVFVLMDGNDRIAAARGCYQNSTCENTEKASDKQQCAGPRKADLCMECCYGNLCIDFFYSGSETVYASLSLMMFALLYALSLIR